ncbi:hypothetical protein CHLRE_06g278118v5 [Chlamydomonas reinhardtii]|uniref:Uncharacterized protein n=1 Tax=Chlamydomonas reinhardtii TaxID=3055 RepID=A0A2K3DNX8_CHLRE|nr:uncharacterized protein CHLRE_06g278118v5 [Chlamydomonas reinhardtii]PNW82227.1 hypothetical protein CHLRE_06g278118v5 [Chlamydomonas reinhardtii]
MGAPSSHAPDRARNGLRFRPGDVPAASEPDEPAASAPPFAFAPRQPDQVPGAPDRDVSLSLALALTCSVVRDLLDLVGEDVHAGSATPAAARTVVVPAVPTAITPLGLRLLDEWALQRQAAEAAAVAAGGSAVAVAAAGPAWRAWLSAFLAGHATAITNEAAAAADFLGCSSFLQVVAELQLVRVVLADRAALEAFVEAGGRKQLRRQDRERRLSKAQLQHLPCLTASSAPGGAGGAGGAPASGSAAPAAAAAPADAGGGNGGGDGGGGPRLEDSGPLGRVVVMGPRQLEALVAALCSCEWLAACSPQPQHVRRVLVELGFRQCLTFTREGEREQHNGRSAYLCAPLPAMSGGRAEVTSVAVEAEAHDQGWSSYPSDRGSYRNSWTWGELVLVGPPNGQPLRQGDPGRLFTNRHADRNYQTHRVVQGPDSAVVQDLNEKVYGGGGAAAVGGGGAAVAGGGEAAAAAGGGGGAGGYELRLMQCAAFPGWCHSMRRATITVHFK